MRRVTVRTGPKFRRRPWTGPVCVRIHAAWCAKLSRMSSHLRCFCALTVLLALGSAALFKEFNWTPASNIPGMIQELS